MPIVSLTRLTLHEFRGVRNLTLNPNGQNVGLFGANGSGKSSVADAIEFLLTGTIRRLTGEGAGKLSLGKHGPHVDAERCDAWVEAEWRVTAGGKSTRVRRSVAEPDQLDHDGVLPPAVAALFCDGAHASLFMLTRREILRYICAEPSKRGEQIGALLDLTRVDAVRKAITGAARLASERHKEASEAYSRRHEAVLRSVDPPAADLDGVLARVNLQRARFGGDSLATLSPTSIRRGLHAPTIAATSGVYSPRTTHLVHQLREWFAAGAASVAAEVREYGDAIRQLHADADRVATLRAHDLLRRGRELAIADACPLCLTPWHGADLRALLEGRLAAARETMVLQRDFRTRRDNLRSRIATVIEAARDLARDVAGEAASRTIAAWSDEIAATVELLLPDPIDDAAPDAMQVGQALAALSSRACSAAVDRCGSLQSGAPAPSPDIAQWVELSGIESGLKELEREAAHMKQAGRLATELTAAQRLFVAARDSVLQATYDGIVDRFGVLYRQVHGVDESAFQASLRPTQAGVDLAVDFHGRGEYPPNALHSEGHQDSMGLCLFLALTDHLANGKPPLLVLDDVLTSIDADHRRAVADMLRKEFSGSQLIITTHDQVWWRQLQSFGVVQRQNAYAFNAWTLEDGPRAAVTGVGALGEAESALASGNVPAAAAALRRAVEARFAEICDALGASVRYRSDGRNEAGEYLDAALSKYRTLLGDATKAAATWGNPTKVDWSALEALRKSACAGFSSEAWAVNVNVHFNEWANFTVADFAPVLVAYKQLLALFYCGGCNGALRVTEEGKEQTGVRCLCKAVDWNLVKKPGNVLAATA